MYVAPMGLLGRAVAAGRPSPLPDLVHWDVGHLCGSPVILPELQDEIRNPVPFFQAAGESGVVFQILSGIL